MTVASEDVFLETVIAETLAAAPAGQDPQTTARQIIAAVAERASERFVVPALDKGTLRDEHGRGYFNAATPLGSYSATGPSCIHLYSYSDGVAGDPKPDPDNIDYMHICELDAFIAMLINLRELRRRFDAGEPVEVCAHECVVQSLVDGVMVPEYCQACGKTIGDRPSPELEPAAPEPTPSPVAPETVPCPGGSCPQYLYGMPHQHTETQP